MAGVRWVVVLGAGLWGACAPEPPQFQDPPPSAGGQAGQGGTQGAGEGGSGGTSGDAGQGGGETAGVGGEGGGTGGDVLVEIFAGGYNTCVRSLGGRVRCWGSNKYGESAHSMNKALLAIPTEIPALAGASALSLGLHHGCGLWEMEARCWGWNGCDWLASMCRGGGALGTGDSLYKPDCTKTDPSCGSNPVPTKIATTAALVNVQAGGNFSCAKSINNQTLCWGSNSQSQMGGERDNNPHPTPQYVSKADGILDFYIGSESILARRSGGASSQEWLAWGWNGSGVLSLDPSSMNYEKYPKSSKSIQDLENIVVSKFGEHACGIHRFSKDGVWCWGHNGCGQIGKPADSACTTATSATSKPNFTPEKVVGFGEVKKVVLGFRHTCVLNHAGKVFCWGDRSNGQLGIGIVGGAPISSPQLVSLAFPALDLTVGVSHACALLEDRSIWCWGRNEEGQLANGTNVNSGKPLRIEGLQ